MSKKVCKIIIIVVIILAIILGIMYSIDLGRMKEGKPVVFSTWGAKYAPIKLNNVNDVQSNANNTENYQKYSKIIDDTKIELNIPNEWHYEEVARNEENDFYRYALKIYKSDENKCAMLYCYNNQLGVCGTGRTSRNITLNNGKEAIIGYYDGNKNWNDISFYNIDEFIAVMNSGLEDQEAEDAIEIIKTINITNEKNEYSFISCSN